MTGPQPRDLLSAWLDGELAPDERDAVDLALQQDPALKAESEALGALVRDLGSMPEQRAPDDFLARVMAKVDDIAKEDDLPAFAAESVNSAPPLELAPVASSWSRLRAPLLYASAAGLALMVGISVVQREEMGPPAPAALVAATENLGPLPGGIGTAPDGGDAVVDLGPVEDKGRLAPAQGSRRANRAEAGEKAVYEAEWERAEAPPAADAPADFAPDPPMAAAAPAEPAEPAAPSAPTVTPDPSPKTADLDAVALADDVVPSVAFRRSARADESLEERALGPAKRKAEVEAAVVSTASSAGASAPAPARSATVPASSPAEDGASVAQARLATEFTDVLGRLRTTASSHGWAFRVISSPGEVFGPDKGVGVVEFVLPAGQVESLGQALAVHGAWSAPTLAARDGSARVRVAVTWRE
jgi:negative regulator of sigma E activity